MVYFYYVVRIPQFSKENLTEKYGLYDIFSERYQKSEDWEKTFLEDLSEFRIKNNIPLDWVVEIDYWCSSTGTGYTSRACLNCVLTKGFDNMLYVHYPETETRFFERYLEDTKDKPDKTTTLPFKPDMEEVYNEYLLEKSREYKFCPICFNYEITDEDLMKKYEKIYESDKKVGENRDVNKEIL